ncbi:MAG: hypothetical protein JJ864_01195 [Rhizobiaceae bacterium]|nr:hypothetical protein [Rhizobiaceae bacterium]
MRAASRLIQIAAFAALFTAYAYAQSTSELSGVRRALQTIGTAVEPDTGSPDYRETA